MNIIHKHLGVEVLKHASQVKEIGTLVPLQLPVSSVPSLIRIVLGKVLLQPAIPLVKRTRLPNKQACNPILFAKGTRHAYGGHIARNIRLGTGRRWVAGFWLTIRLGSSQGL